MPKVTQLLPVKSQDPHSGLTEITTLPETTAYYSVAASDPHAYFVCPARCGVAYCLRFG